MTRLIDADKLKEYIDAQKGRPFIGCTIGEALKIMTDEQPTVDAQPVRHGRWVRDEFGTRCGACGLYAYRDKFDQPWESPYCPNCGAKMGD